MIAGPQGWRKVINHLAPGVDSLWLADAIEQGADTYGIGYTVVGDKEPTGRRQRLAHGFRLMATGTSTPLIVRIPGARMPA